VIEFLSLSIFLNGFEGLARWGWMGIGGREVEGGKIGRLRED
jgi:hypothetical protein